jgi:hypothetical protein
VKTSFGIRKCGCSFFADRRSAFSYHKHYTAFSNDSVGGRTPDTTRLLFVTFREDEGGLWYFNEQGCEYVDHEQKG